VSRIVITLGGAQTRPDLGDWRTDGSTLRVNATAGGDLGFLVALHEMIEAWLCMAHDITAEQVDTFDDLFDSEDHADEDEPGDDPRSPYRRQHRFACTIEFMTALELGLVDYGVMR